MTSPNRNIDKEITEGLARSEKMIRRRRTMNRMFILGMALAVLFTLICCAAIGVWFIMNRPGN